MARSAGFPAVSIVGDADFPIGGVHTRDLIGRFVKDVHPTDAGLEFILQDAAGDEVTLTFAGGGGSNVDTAGLSKLVDAMPFEENGPLTVMVPGWSNFDELVISFYNDGAGQYLEAEVFTALLLNIVGTDDDVIVGFGTAGAVLIGVTDLDTLTIRIASYGVTAGDTMTIYGLSTGAGAPAAAAPAAPAGGGGQVHVVDAPPGADLGADGDTAFETAGGSLNLNMHKKASGSWGLAIGGMVGEGPRPEIRYGYFLPRRQADWVTTAEAYDLSIADVWDALTTAAPGLDFELTIAEDPLIPGMEVTSQTALTFVKPVSDGSWSYVFGLRARPFAPGYANLLGLDGWNETETWTVDGVEWHGVGAFTNTVNQSGIVTTQSTRVRPGTYYWRVR